MNRKQKDIHTKGKNNKKKKYQFIKKGHGNEPTVIEFNLSKAVIFLIAIGVIIATITTVKVITSIMRAQENNVLSGEESNEHVVWVESTDVDEEGNPIKVPVPKGYSASKIPGETSANNGFVIYEGEVDWDSILVDTASQNTISTQSVENGEPSANDTATAGEENTTNTINQNENTVNTNTSNTTGAEGNSATNNTNSQTENTNTENITTESDKTNQDAPTNTTNTTEQENTSNEQNIIEENKQETPANSTTENENQLKEVTEASETSLETEKTTTTETNEEETDKIDAETPIQGETSTVENANNVENSTEQETENSQETANKNQQTENNAQTLANDITSTEATDAEPRAVTQQDINIFNLQKERNQYVWVPVKDPSRIYGVDSNGKLWGKLYNYSSTGRTARNWTETNGTMSITSKINFREPDITHYNTNFDIDSRLQSFLDGKTQYELLLKELEENFYLTIKSIKEYGGFYIGRYETGNLSGTAVVRKMNEDISNQTWYTMYEKTKDLKEENDYVMTSMIWGALWDETLQWLIDSEATTSDGTKLTYELISKDSTLWQNCRNSTFYYIPAASTTPEVTEEKVSGTSTKIPTGSSEYTKVNNIYDLTGNVYDWTLEAANTGYRVYRGGVCYGYSNDSANNRNYATPRVSNTYNGCRTLLFIR